MLGLSWSSCHLQSASISIAILSERMLLCSLQALANKYRADANDLAPLASAMGRFAGPTRARLVSAEQQAPLSATLTALTAAAEALEGLHAAALTASGRRLQLNECGCGEWVPWKLGPHCTGGGPSTTAVAPAQGLPGPGAVASPLSPLTSVMQSCRWLANVSSQQIEDQVILW